MYSTTRALISLGASILGVALFVMMSNRGLMSMDEVAFVEARQAEILSPHEDVPLPYPLVHPPVITRDMIPAGSLGEDGTDADDTEPVPAGDTMDVYPGDTMDVYPRAMLHEKGRALLRDGKVAVVTVAGGQGTRLGHPLPKGTFQLDLQQGFSPSLFEFLSGQIRHASEVYETPIPWLVMCSGATYDATLDYMREKEWLGVGEENVHLFNQASYPLLVYPTGEVCMDEKGQVRRGPDGHGGLLAALETAGLYDSLQSQGVTTLLYSHVDNPLSNLFDLDFIGLHTVNRAEHTTKVISKAFPLEKLGGVVLTHPEQGGWG
ncbi:UTP--glucose-1-phosphate uridylyltransferase family protein [Kipferlia bialata]|uniref:UDP-N-acetylglucosamine diphosphorylase n=1 Tax=Kipferlia bialata TaxID=797122 RepID=A0A9K3GMC8_9EUKA|nr:UTP--glucose-1-phosphate uridylyltransferase family protein [Kipferlia bialata]|eukprot:g9761.t1